MHGSYLTSTITNVNMAVHMKERNVYDVLYDDGTTGTSIPVCLRHVQSFIIN